MDRFISNLNLEGPLEPAGEESSEGAHDGGEAGQGDAVDLERVELHRGLKQTEHSLTSAPELLGKGFHLSSEEMCDGWRRKRVSRILKKNSEFRERFRQG